MNGESALQLYRALLDHLDVAVLVADDSATYVDANASACALLGLPRDAIVGHGLWEFVVDGTREAVLLQWKAFLRDGAQSGVFPMKVERDREVLVQFHATANVVQGLHCSFLSPTSPLSSAPPSGDERFLVVCAWTHRVKWEGRWVSLEEYLQRAHGVSVSHGMCPDAFRTHFSEEPDE